MNISCYTYIVDIYPLICIIEITKDYRRKKRIVNVICTQRFICSIAFLQRHLSSKPTKHQLCGAGNKAKRRWRGGGGGGVDHMKIENSRGTLGAIVEYPDK